MRKIGHLNVIRYTETHHLQFVIKEIWDRWANIVICRVTWPNKINNLQIKIMLYLSWELTLMEYQNVCHLETEAHLALFMVTEISKIWTQIVESVWKIRIPITAPEEETSNNSSKWVIIVVEGIRSSKCNNSLLSKGGRISLSVRDSWITRHTIHLIFRTKRRKKMGAQDLILALHWIWWRKVIFKTKIISRTLEEVSRIPRVKDCHHLKQEEVSAPFPVALIQ